MIRRVTTVDWQQSRSPARRADSGAHDQWRSRRYRARYRYREDLYPSLTFRRAYDALVRTHGERADVEYLRILQLAATAGETRVAEVLMLVLDQGARFDYVTVQAQVAPPVLTVPVIRIPVPDLSVYDALRAGAAA